MGELFDALFAAALLAGVAWVMDESLPLILQRCPLPTPPTLINIRKEFGNANGLDIK